MALHLWDQRIGLIEHANGHIGLSGQIVEPRRQGRAAVWAGPAVDPFRKAAFLGHGGHRDIGISKGGKDW